MINRFNRSVIMWCVFNRQHCKATMEVNKLVNMIGHEDERFIMLNSDHN